MLLYKSRIPLFLGLLLFCGCLTANGAVLRGKVTDAVTGESLPGASITLAGSNKGVVSDEMGNFQMENLPEGSLTFTVQFLGYQELTFTKSFSTNDILTHDIKLLSATEELQSVSVYGRAMGQVRALKQQQNAENIINVVSAEQIASFPDLNAADAMQRITGITLQRDQGEGRFVQLRGTPPEFTNFNVNGIQLPSPESDIRTVGMDVINASQIQTIEVSKVLTPDMNADAIGGTVNLITKRAEGADPQIRGLVSGGFNNLRKTGNTQMQFTFSERVGRFGFLINANYNYSKQGADNLEFKYEKGTFFGDTSGNNVHLQWNEVQLRHYNVVRQRIGLSSTLDYRVNENTTVYINGMYNNYSDNEERRRKVFTLDDALSERSYLFGGIEHDLKAREKIQTISTINAGVEHKWRRAIIDYEIGWSEAREEQPNRMEVAFENPGQAIFIRFNNSVPRFPKPTFPRETNSSNATDWENYEMDELLLEDHLAKDRNLIGRFNVKLPYKLKGQNGYVKFGSLVRTKDKSRDINSQSYGAYFPNSTIYPLGGDPLNLNTISDDFKEDNLLGEGYEMSHMPSPNLMRNFYERFPTLFIFGDAGVTQSRELSFGEDYTATEDVYAGYGMMRHDFNKLMVIAGLRFERTDINYQGFQISKGSSGFFTKLDTVDAQRRQVFFLPNLQFKYTVNEGFNVRAALTQSYARPNFRDVVPYRVVEERNEVQFGNPDLDYPKATNADFLVEKYWGRANMISGGVFYKNIQNFIFNYKIFGFEGDPTQSNFNKVQVELPLNGETAQVRGLEVQSQFMFDKLPGIWKNMGFFGNYTFTDSEAEINARLPANEVNNVVIFGSDYNQFFSENGTETISLPGQAQHSFNAALFYDTRDFYFKVAANYTDDFLFRLGADSDLDEYYASNWRVDINGYYQFTKNFQVFADIRNVTNAPLRFFLGKPNNGRLRQQEFYSFWARIGIKFNF